MQERQTKLITTMKKLFSTIITLIGVLCAYGQDTDSLQKVIVEPLTEIQRDSLLTNLEERVHQIADKVFWIRCFTRYKVYRTFNIYTSLKLDTATGRITALQIGINDRATRHEYSVCDALIPSGEINGRFELYPTGNDYNFILMDNMTGVASQVQWSYKREECGLRGLIW